MLVLAKRLATVDSFAFVSFLGFSFLLLLYKRTKEEINPNKKFIKNEVLKILRQNVHFKEQLEKRKIDYWKLDGEYVDIIFRELLASDIYKSYMSNELSSFDEDKQFVLDFFKKIIAPNEKLHEYLEDKNIPSLPNNLKAQNKSLK